MKSQSKPVAEHSEVPLADDGRLEEIAAHWQQRSLPKGQSKNKTDSQKLSGKRCYIVTIMSPGDLHPEGKKAEILGLIKALGDRPVSHEV
ncbi:MAG: GTP-binding protein HflX, partial [Lentisphaeria bacterium]